MKTIFEIEVIISGIVTAIIIAVGNKKDDWTLQLTGLGLLIGTLLFLFMTEPKYADAFTGMATIIVAIAAFGSIEESRRLRRENAEKEARDRKDNIRSEVLGWALDTLKSYSLFYNIICVIYDDKGRPFVEDENAQIHGLYSSSLESEFSGLRDRAKYIKLISHEINNKAENSVMELWVTLTELVRYLSSIRVAIDVGADAPSVFEGNKIALKISEPCNTVIEEIAKEKLKLTANV